MSADTFERAKEIWRTRERTPEYLRDTDFESIFKLAANHFAEIYKCATGHAMKDIYVAALPFDFLQALSAVMEADAGSGVWNALPIRIGDTVECVDAWDSFNNLTIGKLYEALDARDGMVFVRGNSGHVGGWWASHFKHVVPTEPAP